MPITWLQDSKTTIRSSSEEHMVRYTAVHTICDSLDVHGRYIEKLFYQRHSLIWKLGWRELTAKSVTHHCMNNYNRMHDRMCCSKDYGRIEVVCSRRCINSFQLYNNTTTTHSQLLITTIYYHGTLLPSVYYNNNMERSRESVVASFLKVGNCMCLWVCFAKF